MVSVKVRLLKTLKLEVIPEWTPENDEEEEEEEEEPEEEEPEDDNVPEEMPISDRMKKGITLHGVKIMSELNGLVLQLESGDDAEPGDKVLYDSYPCKAFNSRD